MKTKVYSLYGKAIDADGFTHYVTVVGLFEQHKRTVDEVIDTDVHLEDSDKKRKCTLIMKHKEKVRSLSLGSAISHPCDEFNEEAGISLATHRAKKDPIGKVETTNITMLNDDACTALVFTELRHIINKIEGKE